MYWIKESIKQLILEKKQNINYFKLLNKEIIFISYINNEILNDNNKYNLDKNIQNFLLKKYNYFNKRLDKLKQERESRSSLMRSVESSRKKDNPLSVVLEENSDMLKEFELSNEAAAPAAPAAIGDEELEEEPEEGEEEPESEEEGKEEPESEEKGEEEHESEEDKEKEGKE